MKRKKVMLAAYDPAARVQVRQPARQSHSGTADRAFWVISAPVAQARAHRLRRVQPCAARAGRVAAAWSGSVFGSRSAARKGATE